MVKERKGTDHTYGANRESGRKKQQTRNDTASGSKSNNQNGKEFSKDVYVRNAGKENIESDIRRVRLVPIYGLRR